MSERGADALLFDLGNVIYRIDFNRALDCWAAHASCDRSSLRGRFPIDAALRQHEIGAITDADFFASLRASLGVDLSDAQFLEGWNAIFLEEAPGIADTLADAAARVPVYAFSNTNAAHEAHWSQKYAGTLAHFRKIFVSHTIGFRLVVAEIGIPADRILFFDDSRANVDGAHACGLQAVHVTKSSDVTAASAAVLR